MIYDFITQRGVLFDHHRKELKEKRGFTDEVISSGRFFSGGKYFLDIQKELMDGFTTERLLESGVFIKPDRAEIPVFAPQLLEDRIVIPYLNKEDRAIFIRPHKLGLEVPIQIYHEKVQAMPNGFAILTESEFKAVAGVALGFKSIGIPGISSFSDQHFPRLVDFIQKANVKEVCIIFDNEIKDNPAFPNYKEEPFKRYDTEYFAYITAQGLIKEGIDARIGKLPDSWRTNGKIDLDGALAMGKTKEDIQHVIDQAKNPRAFIQDQTTEVQNILNRKLAKKYYRSNISIDWGKYVATRRAGKTEWQETISNFTIKIIARHETQEGVIREVILINEFNKQSKSFPLPAEPMSKPDAFSTFCLNHGNYVWKGTGQDLKQIWQGLFLEDDGRHIIEPDHVGWINDEKMFLFGNLAIKDTGEVLRPDKNNIFWVEKHGIKPVPISTSSGRNAISEGIPIISVSEINIKDIHKKFEDTLGVNEARVLLGWAAAVMFLEEVFSAFNCFPFLFITGRRGSGKSTIAEWAMNLFGIETGGKMASDTTAVAIQRYLGYYSALPVFIDEYRNTKNITVKNGFLRNVYNRQSAGKGIKAAFGVREGKVRGTLLVSGEETPDDNALLTRCVVINVLEKNRVVNHFNWFQTHRAGLSYLTYSLLTRKAKLVPNFMENLHGGKDFFVKRGLDDRMAINFAVIGAGYLMAAGSLPDEFQDYLATESARVKQEYDEENAVGIFLEGLLSMQSNGVIKEKLWDYDIDFIYLYFNGLYSIWASEYRKVHGTEPFKAAALHRYLEEEQGYVQSQYQKKIGKYNRRCIVFKRREAPKEIQELMEVLLTDEQRGEKT